MIAVPKCLAWSPHVPLKVELTHTPQMNNGLSHILTHVTITQSKVKINCHAATESCVCVVFDKSLSIYIEQINIIFMHIIDVYV